MKIKNRRHHIKKQADKQISKGWGIPIFDKPDFKIVFKYLNAKQRLYKLMVMGIGKYRV